ncbi:MAG: hypothetical protein ACK4NY_05265 [Spirosomataceae bacterium]
MKKILLLTIILLFSANTKAQQATIIDTKSMIVPRYADLGVISNAIGNPQVGMLVYNNSTQSYWFFTSSGWTNLAAAVSGNWVQNGANISNTNPDNVGVGHPNPSYKLHVGNANNGFRVEGAISPLVGGKTFSMGGYGNFEIDKPGVVAGRFMIRENGNIGINNIAPAALLDIGGGNNWDLTNTEGDFRIGNSLYRLKMGVALGGGGAGTVNIRAVGGVNSLNLGAGTNNGITINGSGYLGIGNISPTSLLSFPNGFGRKISLHDNGTGDQYGIDLHAGLNGLMFVTPATNADIGRDISFGHSTSTGNYWERFNIKANGGLSVSNGVGANGQVLTSQGNGQAAAWKNSGNTDQYNSFIEVKQTAVITPTTTAGEYLTGLEHTLNLSKPALVTVVVNTSVNNDGCFGCLTVQALIELEVNGGVWGTSTIQLENTTSGVYLSSGNLIYERTYKLAAGNYTFKVKGKKGLPFGGGSTGTVWFNYDAAQPFSFARWGYMNFNIVYP